MNQCGQCGGYHGDSDDGAECICGLCEDGVDCPVHETGRYARQTVEVIDMRPDGPKLAPGQSLEEFCDLYQRFS